MGPFEQLGMVAPKRQRKSPVISLVGADAPSQIPAEIGRQK
jgi:hypothetical protein